MRIIRKENTMNTPGAFHLLNTHKKHLTPQQVRTIKGQIKAGEIEAAMKGLQRLINKKLDYSQSKSHHVS